MYNFKRDEIFDLILVFGLILISSVFFIEILNHHNKEKKDWEKIQNKYYCELKEVNNLINIYNCKSKNNKNKNLFIKNDYKLSSSNKNRLKTNCNLISQQNKMFVLSCDNNTLKVTTSSLDDFLIN